MSEDAAFAAGVASEKAEQAEEVAAEAVAKAESTGWSVEDLNERVSALYDRLDGQDARFDEILSRLPAKEQEKVEEESGIQPPEVVEEAVEEEHHSKPSRTSSYGHPGWFGR